MFPKADFSQSHPKWPCSALTPPHNPHSLRQAAPLAAVLTMQFPACGGNWSIAPCETWYCVEVHQFWKSAHTNHHLDFVFFIFFFLLCHPRGLNTQNWCQNAETTYFSWKSSHLMSRHTNCCSRVDATAQMALEQCEINTHCECVKKKSYGGKKT